MSCISVVRLGPTDENVSSGMLRNAILHYFAPKQGDDDDALLSNDRLQVTNKYFHAQILLREISDTNNVVSKYNLPLKEDGIILVFDAAKSNPDLVVADGVTAASFESLSFVHEKAEHVGGGDLLRLCVGVTIGSMGASELRGHAYEKEYARRINWCLDRGYEYVECDLSREGQAKGHDERDKEGFARIIEAISGTMWSSAVMTQDKKAALKKSYQEQAAVLEEQSQENEYIPPDPSMLLGSGEDREEQARRAVLEQSGIDLETTQGSLVASGQENINPETSRQQREREQERMFDNLESALRQASSIRDMSRTADLSDDDRRKRAGDAADLLMTLMQQVGIDDSDDEEPEENDSC